MTRASKWGHWTALLAGFALLMPAAAQNLRPAQILGNFDIDGQGGADVSPDTDGDGLPDSWEVGGLDSPETDVAFPAPDAIVPGTPPQPIFNRRPVRTSATARDTDGDGLSDFVEVFGLMFIDENRNGILDNAAVFNPDGSVQTVNGVAVRATVDGEPVGEWFDFNQDGLPSIGEFPARNVLIPGASENYDFDGFVFTDPTNPDTDGDGLLDGADNDPLINPSSFGDTRGLASFPCGDILTDFDCDNDGLGNGMDLGSDVDQVIDNPSDLERVLQVFRPDLLVDGGAVRVPEALIEDLLGADWNGDGLFRLTDILDPAFGLAPGSELSILVGALDLFQVEDPDDAGALLFLGFAVTPFPVDSFSRQTYYRFAARESGDPPLSFQRVLVPAGRDENIFLPDPRIWTVLYSWRFPGFDVDGNGFIGFDGASFSGDVSVNGETVEPEDLGADNAPSSEHALSGATGGAGVIGSPSLDGVVEVNPVSICPVLGFSVMGLLAAGLARGRARR